MNPTLSYGPRFVKNAAVFSASAEAYSLPDPIPFKFPGQPIFLSNDAGLVEHVMVSNRQKYRKSKIYWQVLRGLVGEALGSVEGEQWQWMRQMQQPYFRPASVPGYLDDVERGVEAMISDLKGNCQQEAVRMFAALNIRIILKILFGASASAPYDEIATNIAEGEAFIAWQSKYPWRKVFAPWTRSYKQAQQSLSFFGSFLDTLIEERSLAREKSRCLIDELIDHLPPADPALTHENLRNEIIIHLGASTETLAVAESWAIYLLIRHPEILQRVRTEINVVAGGAQLNSSHLPDLVYLKQVLREAMRLYPPTHALVRDATEADTIRGHTVSPGDTVYLSVYGLHRNPKYWPDPDRFDPDRFEKSRYEKIPKYQYVPFGIGPHTCIGQHIAMPMMLLTVGRLVQQFQMDLVSAEELTPVSLSTLKPNKDMLLSFHSPTYHPHESPTSQASCA